MDYITADTESMVAFYTEQETLESPEVQGIMRERKQELEAVDFREQIIKGLVNILCKSSDLDNDDMNPHMQLRVFLYQQQQQPLMEKLQLVSGR
jgi:predicted nuclease of restriction endonuclease-like RecB superfamily